MVDDPIVNEVREIRESLASECNYNLHTYFEMLRMEDSKRMIEKSKVFSSKPGANDSAERSKVCP